MGGSVARVVDGNMRDGWPGAPGCTMTGAFGSVCWAKNESAKMHVRIAAPIPAVKGSDFIVARSNILSYYRNTKLYGHEQYKVASKTGLILNQLLNGFFDIFGLRQDEILELRGVAYECIGCADATNGSVKIFEKVV